MFTKVISLLLVICMLSSMLVLPSVASDIKDITVTGLDDYGKIYFNCLTNKDFTRYEVGEEMAFTVTLYGDGEKIAVPYFKYTLKGDDGLRKSGFVDGSAGEYTFKTSLTQPGGVYLMVEPANADKKVISDARVTKLEAGALAGADEITTTLAEPLDFDDFWEKNLAELDTVAPELYEIQKISSDTKWDTYVIKVNCVGDVTDNKAGNTWTVGHLTIPKNAGAGSLGLRATFQGYGVNSSTAGKKNGFVTFNVCAHSMEQNQAAGYYSFEGLGLREGTEGKMYNYGFSPELNADPDNSYFKYMLLRDVQAVRFMKTFFGAEGGVSSFTATDGTSVNTGAWKGLWNGKDIEVAGGSQGGFQSIAVAALDKDVTSVNAANVPWFSDVAGDTVPTKIASTFRPKFAEGLLYYDTSFFARRIKDTDVIITAGAGDPLCTMNAVQCIYNNLNSKTASIKFSQGQTHGSTASTGESFTHNKVAGVPSVDNVYLETEYSGESLEVFEDVFATAWTSLTGNDAEFVTDAAGAEYAIVVSDFDSVTYKDYSNTAVGIAITGEPTALGEAHKQYLTLAAAADSNVHLCTYAADASDVTALAREIATQFTGSVFDNQSKADLRFIAIQEDGTECANFITADDLTNVNVYGLTSPLSALKNINLSIDYKSPDETGTEYGVLTASSSVFSDVEMRAYDKKKVTGYGVDAGAEWIICGETLDIFGEGDISDTEYDWNEKISDVTAVNVNEGVTHIGAGAFDLPSNARIALPFSLDTIDNDALCGKKDITVAAHLYSVGESFAAENGIAFESLGMTNVCSDNICWKFNAAYGTLTIAGTGTVLDLNPNVTDWDTSTKNNYPWIEHIGNVKKLIITAPLTRVESYVFARLENCKTIVLPDTNINLSSGWGIFGSDYSLSKICTASNESGTPDNTFDIRTFTGNSSELFKGSSTGKTVTILLPEDIKTPIDVSRGESNFNQLSKVVFKCKKGSLGENFADTYIALNSSKYSKTYYLEAGMPGDINGDGEVAISDLVRLAQYLANWDVEIAKEASDCDGSGEIGISDLVRLAQYLANWDVTLEGGAAEPEPEPEELPETGTFWQEEGTNGYTWAYDKATSTLTLTAAEGTEKWNGIRTWHDDLLKFGSVVKKVVLKGMYCTQNDLNFNSAFPNLEEAVIDSPNGVNFELRNNAFNGCKKLTKVTINATKLQLHSYGFANSGIKEITLPAEARLHTSALASNVFDGCESVTVYTEKDSSCWNIFKDVENVILVDPNAAPEEPDTNKIPETGTYEKGSGAEDYGFSWTFDSAAGKLTIKHNNPANGPKGGSGNDDCLAQAFGSYDISAVKILQIDNASAIQGTVRYNYFENVEKLVFGPDSVTVDIGDYCFIGCENLKEIDFGYMTGGTIGSRSFKSIYSLSKVYLPDNITKIEPDSFEIGTVLNYTNGSVTEQALKNAGMIKDDSLPDVQERKRTSIMAGTPTVDGILDAVWDTAEAVDFPYDRNNSDIDNLGSLYDYGEGEKHWVKALWDNNSLYVFFRVFDDNINVDSAIKSYNRDGVELYFDEYNDKGENEKECRRFFYPCINPTGDDTAVATQADYVSDFATVVYDDYYDVEFKIDFETKKNTGDVIGIDFAINCNDTGTDVRDHSLSWNDRTNQTWQYPVYMGEAVLEGTPEETPDTPNAGNSDNEVDAGEVHG